MSYEMSLSRGTPIGIDGVGSIYPLRLSEIEELGVNKYQEMLFCILFDRSTINDSELEELIRDEDTTDFDIIFVLCLTDLNFRARFLSALEIAFRQKPFISDEGFFYLSDINEKRFIHRENYEEIKLAVRKQNMLDGTELTAKAKNNKTKSVMERMKKVKETVSGKKQVKKGLDLHEIIDSVASLSANVNFTTIWDYTIYELYKQFNLIMKKENYDQQFNMILQGADIKPSDFKHWTA